MVFLTLLHLLLLALEGGGNVARVLLGQNAVRGTGSARNAQVRGLRRGLPQSSMDDMIEVLVVRESLETNGGASAGATLAAIKEALCGAGRQGGPIGSLGDRS